LSRAIEKPTHIPGVAVHRAGDDRVGAELVAQLALDHALEAVDLERLPLVGRLARRELHRVERRDALDDRDAVDPVGREQRRAGEVDEARDLLRRLDRARLELEGAEGLDPGEHATGEQHGEQEERAPEQAERDELLRRLRLGRAQPFGKRGSGAGSLGA
jgi:hypothetical protein